MKNFSLPPFRLGEIGQTVLSIGEKTGVPCQAGFSISIIRDNLKAIAQKYSIPFSPSNDLGSLAHQLQAIIEVLDAKQIFIDQK